MGAIRRPTVAQDDPLIGQTVASSNRYCAQSIAIPYDAIPQAV